jgi:hypothetical protein
MYKFECVFVKLQLHSLLNIFRHLVDDSQKLFKLINSLIIYITRDHQIFFKLIFTY